MYLLPRQQLARRQTNFVLVADGMMEVAGSMSDGSDVRDTRICGPETIATPSPRMSNDVQTHDTTEVYANPERRLVLLRAEYMYMQSFSSGCKPCTSRTYLATAAVRVLGTAKNTHGKIVL